MVSLGVPTARFGHKPDPENPQPHYPGVSATRFDPIGAMQAYGDVLWKDKMSRHQHQMLGPKVQHDPATHSDDAIGDLLPSKKSIDSVYERMGFSWHPSTGNPVPPVLEQQQKSPVKRPRQPNRSTDGQPTTRGVASKAGLARKAGGDNSEPRSRSTLAAAALSSCRSGAGRTMPEPSRSAPSLRYASAAAAAKDLDGGKQSSLSKSAPSQLSWPRQTGAPGSCKESQVETYCSLWTLPPSASQLSKIEPPAPSRPLLRSVSEPYHHTVKVHSDTHELRELIFKKLRDKELAFL
mmetsp:Transcript_93314/g.179409  ORF Transcript_93314/g.179409 Transcript_93314/m.179409 type:complete len:294 (-) Transcript_93314:152-1033(-)